MIIDAHIHLFSAGVIAKVSQRRQMVAELHLQTAAAAQRDGTEALCQAMQEAGVDLALHLPTARAAGVSRANDSALALALEFPFLATAGTLHPHWAAIPEELARLHAAGVRALKLCSFSQEFQLDGAPASAMWNHIQDFNRQCSGPFWVVLDTYCNAARHFGSAPAHTTTPGRLGWLSRHFPDICFVGAHMGGLGAPLEALVRDLPAAPNLYLDTSNAAHILSDDAFVRLLNIHGPEHILFGTDWPWFHPREEIERIARLLDKAGFAKHEQELVFAGNALRFLAC